MLVALSCHFGYAYDTQTIESKIHNKPIPFSYLPAYGNKDCNISKVKRTLLFLMLIPGDAKRREPKHCVLKKGNVIARVFAEQQLKTNRRIL